MRLSDLKDILITFIIVIGLLAFVGLLVGSNRSLVLARMEHGYQEVTVQGQSTLIWQKVYTDSTSKR